MRRRDTRIVWGSWRPELDERYEPIVPPIYISAVYRHPPGLGREFPPIGDLKYSRENNPTLLLLERHVCSVEQGKFCLMFNSGMAALVSALFSMVGGGGKITVMRLVYGATRLLLEKLLKVSNIKVSVAGPPWDELLEEAVGSSVVVVETMGNPTLRVPPLRELYGVCREEGCKVLVDNTFASPVIYRPLEEGAHACVESTTKYIGGHNDVVGGLAAFNEKQFYEEAWDWRRLLGGIMQPFEAYLTLRGLKTLHLRVERSSKAAREVAEWLDDNPRVSKVYYPGLPSHPDHERAAKLFNGLYGGVVSFEVKGGGDAALKVLESVRVASPSPSLGAVESLLTYPVWASHGNLPKEEREELGITEGLLRLSVGLEDPSDLIEDLDRALKEAVKL